MLVSHSSCYFSSLEGDIAEVSKNINFWKLVRAGFHAILICGPVYTSFQVDIEIYEDKLGQSVDRILSSHITNIVILTIIIYNCTFDGSTSISVQK